MKKNTICNKLLEDLFKQDPSNENGFFIEKVFSGKNVILYGAGECSHWFVEIIMKMHNVIPIAVLDRKFSSGDKFEGIDAFSPEDYDPTLEIKYNSVVVVCVGNPKTFEEISIFLKEAGFKKIISLLDVYEVHNPFNLPEELNLEVEDRNYFIEKKDRILQAYELFEDEQSREIFYKFVKTHIERKPLPLPSSLREEQYFPQDIKLTKGYSRFINCGSYDGDCVRLLNSKVGKIEELVCFEPEHEIYKRLSKYLKSEPEKIAARIINFPNAVCDDDKIVKFKSGLGLGSRISENGDNVVQAVSLDNCLPCFSPTFISMDVEGMEFKALRGAENMLRRAKPDLGICVYHSVNHIWDIPLWLHSLNLGYKFYLRNYTTFCIETVLYVATA
jgi:FkbM family methyltransferase